MVNLTRVGISAKSLFCSCVLDWLRSGLRPYARPYNIVLIRGGTATHLVFIYQNVNIDNYIKNQDCCAAILTRFNLINFPRKQRTSSYIKGYCKGLIRK